MESSEDSNSDKEGGKLPTPPKTFSKGNRRESVDEQGRSTPLKKRQITNINTRSPLSPTDQSSNKTFQSVKRQLMVRRSPRSKNYCLETSPSPRPPIQLRTEEQDRTDGSMTTSSTASGPCRSSMSLNVISPTCFASLSPEQPTPTSRLERDSETNRDLLRQILSKIELLQNDINSIKNHITSSVDVDVESVDTLLPSGRKLNTSQEIDDFQHSLDENSKRKLVNALASLKGGSNAGDICRTVMRAIMTNHAMSQYSGTGQKGKLPLIGTEIYKVILSAVRKASKKNIPFEEIKVEVLDVLRNAPNQPGGTNYVQKRGKKRSLELPEFPNDSS
uniref:Uncharacterized protein LOC111113885 n=1 Tax=Crassostrea virginica TaxID=6565 RepID=A0A8B8BYH4_CRAVI|nr:uncharacterized protein LOC111113885 [Crassostrea virginica]